MEIRNPRAALPPARNICLSIRLSIRLHCLIRGTYRYATVSELPNTSTPCCGAACQGLDRRLSVHANLHLSMTTSMTEASIAASSFPRSLIALLRPCRESTRDPLPGCPTPTPALPSIAGHSQPVNRRPVMASPPPPGSPGSDSEPIRSSEAVAGLGLERRRMSSAAAATGFSLHESYSSPEKGGLRARMGLSGVARRTLGISLLLVTVFLWTTSNFLASVGALCRRCRIQGADTP